MIRNILVVMPAADSHRRQLEAAAPGAVFTYASSPAEEDVARADAIVGNIRPELLAQLRADVFGLFTGWRPAPGCRPRRA